MTIFCSGHIFTFSFLIPLLASIPPNHYSLGVLASIIFLYTVKRIGLKLLKFHEIMTIDVRQTSPLMLPRAKNATAPNASFTQNDKSLEPPSSLSTNTSVVITEKRRSRPSRRYLLGALLGKGGNAVVYQCTCLETCEQFAIKILSKERLVQTKTLSSVSDLMECRLVLAIRSRLLNSHLQFVSVSLI
jgi:hypothetical protein